MIRFLLASVTVYALMGFFSGLPAGANLGAFVIGLIILFLAIAALVGFAWYAVAKPLPANQLPSKQLPLTHGLRQGVALLLSLMSAVGIAGGIWDVTWHVHSGIPFGEDFFWQPHQFIYVALGMPILIAGFLWVRMLRNSSGSLRQRFQADIPVTLIFIGGVAMLFTLPADPLWHLIYGEDLTGLSVPHIVFSISSTFTALGTFGILLSYTPVRKTWTSISKLNVVEVLIIISCAFNYVSILMPTLGDWEAISLSTHALPRLPALVAARPDWSMPFLAAFISIYTVTMALQITRRAGTATLVWLVASIIRSVAFTIFGYGDTGMNTMFLTLPFVLTVDIVTWYRASRSQPASSVMIAAVATVVGAVAVLPQITILFTDPVLSASNVPLMLPAIFAGALTASWMGRMLGDVAVNTVRFAVPAEQPVLARPVVRIMSAVSILIAIIAALFIVTSTMPSA